MGDRPRWRLFGVSLRQPRWALPAAGVLVLLVGIVAVTAWLLVLAPRAAPPAASPEGAAPQAAAPSAAEVTAGSTSVVLETVEPSVAATPGPSPFSGIAEPPPEPPQRSAPVTH